VTCQLQINVVSVAFTPDMDTAGRWHVRM